MNKILLVEDSPDYQLILRKALARPQFKLVMADSAKKACEAIDAEEFDLIVLDLILPDSDGFTVLQHLQSLPSGERTAVIFLTGESDVSRKIAAFSMGAEDYLVKPVNPLELRARVEAKLKRINESRQESSVLTHGVLRFEIASQRLQRVEGGKSEEIRMTPLEFKLLLYLARHEGMICSRDQILDAVWGNSVNVLDRTVDTHVSSVRKKLGKLSSCVESVPGSGYRFNAPRPNSGSGSSYSAA